MPEEVDGKLDLAILPSCMGIMRCGHHIHREKEKFDAYTHIKREGGKGEDVHHQALRDLQGKKAKD